jgi:hypothetical protein
MATFDEFLLRVQKFDASYGLPIAGDDQTVTQFLQHNACWHKSCYEKYSALKLARLMRD